jgi:hypothetical protein
MGKVISVEIPEQWLQGLDWDQKTVVQEVIQLGTHQLKIRRALELYQAGVGSLGYVAETVGLSERPDSRSALARH